MSMLDSEERVDATGARRMLRAMTLRRIPTSEVAAAIGYPRSTVRDWLYQPTLPRDADTKIRAFYVEHLGLTGPHTRGTTNAVNAAIAAGALPDHAWTADTIDDPAADPGRASTEPHRVRRRLRALARDGHPLPELGRLLGEHPTVTAGWAATRPVPVYAVPLVVGLFDDLAGTIGPDRDAAAEAKRQRWPSSMAWLNVDIDDPAATPIMRLAQRPKTAVDPANVAGAVGGWMYRADLTAAELKLAVAELGRTRTARQIAARLRWSRVTEDSSPATLDAAGAALYRYACTHHIAVRPAA
jgi:hypothetical protein